MRCKGTLASGTLQGVASTKERLLDIALDVFVELGYEGTSVSELERRVGLAAGTGSFYRHFRSKDELLQAAVDREVEQVMAAIPEDREEGLAGALRDIRRFDRLLRLALVDGDRVPQVRDALATALKGPGDQIRWEDQPELVVALAALGGYHVMSLVQGRPFQDMPEAEFLAALARLTGAD
jgi:AcrR family transcriptional regulator